MNRGRVRSAAVARLRPALVYGTFTCLVAAMPWALDRLQHRLWGCPFRLMVGLPCPVCGLGRAWSALGHGDWRLALTLNPLATLAFPAILVLGLAAVYCHLRPGAADQSRIVRWLIAPRLLLPAVLINWLYLLLQRN